jgi:hypothetical protein
MKRSMKIAICSGSERNPVPVVIGSGSLSIDSHPPQNSPQDVYCMLEATRGARGRVKTLEDIDPEIDRMWSEWDRKPPST